MTTTSRREFLKAGGLALAGLRTGALRDMTAVMAGARHLRPLAVIEMRSDTMGSRVWFDPLGLFVEPGTTVRWIVRENVHTATAYHPRNDKHSLRIPPGAIPWDSGYLVNPGDHFDVTLTVPGIYDYYCIPHEAVGMVGRIVVGKAAGPGGEPFDYWVGKPGTEGWRSVPEAAQDNFPDVARILREHQVHAAPRR